MTNTIASTARVADCDHDSTVTTMAAAAGGEYVASDTAIVREPGRPIRLLVFTSLYPNSERPRHGIFVEGRLRHLLATGKISATVVAPVPWFPFRSRRFGVYAAFARVPECEERQGIHILHPRYPVIPKVGMNVAAGLMMRATLPAVREMANTNEFDLIDAHYFYPDGVAAARLGEAMGKPVVITARGSDVNVIAGHGSPRRQICWAAGRAASIISVSEALQRKIATLGVPPQKLMTLRNGVDLVTFRPMDRAAIRAELGLQDPLWLTVGNLVESKGVHIAIAALAQTREISLVVVGSGPERNALQRLAEQMGVARRVRFIDTVAQSELCTYYNAADVLMLASSREGMPNVVLESLACGTPVVVAPFAGVEELVNAPEAGEVAEARTADAMLVAWRGLSRRQPDRAATRRFAENLGWGPVVEAQCALYAKVLAAQESAKRIGEAT